MGRKVTVYGYQLKNGILRVDKERNRFVQKVFNICNSGISVSRLKGHIKGPEINRVEFNDMPSDKRYIRGENSPKITESELLEAVQQMKKERCKAVGKERPYIYYKEYFLLGDKMKCGECNSKYRYYKHGDKQIWDCSKQTVRDKVHCRNQHIQGAQIKELFMRVATKMKDHPEKIREVAIHKSKRNTRLQAVEHEIKLLRNDSSHNIDELLELIHKRASLQYKDSDDGGAEYYTNKIVGLLQQHKKQTKEGTFDKNLFEPITQTVTMHKDGRVVFTLRNGVNIIEMLP